MSAFNGSGVFVLTGPEYPAVALTLIQAAYRNSLDSAFATGLSACLTRDGQSTATGNIPMGGFKLTGLGLATIATDAASLANLVAGAATYVSVVGGVPNAITLTPSPAITAYATGQRFEFVATATNTSAVTVAISGLTTKAITSNGSTALAAGDIPNGALICIVYDGTRFQLVTTSGLSAADGTTATPAFRFASDSDTGMYRYTTNTVAISAGGTASFWVAPSQAQILDGAVGTPALGFLNDTDTGFYRSTPNQIALALGGAAFGQIATGTYTGTLTGCTTSPTVTVRWAQIGPLMLIFIPTVTATSNATTFTITGGPADIQPTRSQTAPVGEMTDNTAIINTASVLMTSASGTITLKRAGSASGWTNSGTKGVTVDTAFSYYMM